MSVDQIVNTFITTEYVILFGIGCILIRAILCIPDIDWLRSKSNRIVIIHIYATESKAIKKAKTILEVSAAVLLIGAYIVRFVVYTSFR